jgi:hypothetical protein
MPTRPGDLVDPGRVDPLSGALEILHRPLVLLGGQARLERPQIPATPGLWILLSRVETETARSQLPDHEASPNVFASALLGKRQTRANGSIWCRRPPIRAQDGRFDNFKGENGALPCRVSHFVTSEARFRNEPCVLEIQVGHCAPSMEGLFTITPVSIDTGVDRTDPSLDRQVTASRLRPWTQIRPSEFRQIAASLGADTNQQAYRRRTKAPRASLPARLTDDVLNPGTVDEHDVV